MTGEDEHLLRFFPPKPVSFIRGQGAHLWTSAGQRYVDLGGASHGVANFGHAHPRLMAALRRQSESLVHLVHNVPSPVRAGFLKKLHSRLLPKHLARSFLANSGTEAVEAALKFSAAATGRARFVAARNAFHGRTLGALSATFRPQYRKPFERLLQPVTFAPYNDAAALEAAVTHETAAVLLEPIQGEGGLAEATPEYLRAAQRIAHDHGALLILDEIQTGLGRTGHDLAVEGLDVRPDLLLLGKSLAGGLPIGVCSVTAAVAQAQPAGGHGSTFGGSPLVCAVASAAIDVLQDEQLSRRASVEGERVRRRLGGLASPLVREVRGRGLMLGVDLRIKAQPVLDRLLAEGFLALSAGPTVVRLLPPLVTERTDLDQAIDALARILDDPPRVPATPEAVA